MSWQPSIRKESMPLRSGDHAASLGLALDPLFSLIKAREELLAQITSSPEYRATYLNRLVHNLEDGIPETADTALVLGTSPDAYPNKFQTRVFWACLLVALGKVSSVIFTGKSDHETNDVDQAESARQMAISQFGLSPQVIHTVGGDNTQENAQEALRLLPSLVSSHRTLFVVTSPEHTPRALSVIKATINPEGYQTYPSPTGGKLDLNPDDPGVIVELTKTVAYEGILYATPNGIPASASHRQTIDAIVKQYAGTYETLARQRPETPFAQWHRTHNLPHLPRV